MQIKKRWGMLTRFVDATMAVLSNAEIVVWLMLWRDTRRNGLARTTIGYMASRSGMSESMIKRAIKLLIDKDLLKRIRRGGNLNGKRWISLWLIGAVPFKTKKEKAAATKEKEMAEKEKILKEKDASAWDKYLRKT